MNHLEDRQERDGSLPQNTLNSMANRSMTPGPLGILQCLSDSCSKTLIEHWNGSQWSIVKGPTQDSIRTF